MRYLKIAFAGLITVLAMFASLLVALGVALIGIVVYTFLRLRGPSATGPFRPTPGNRRTGDPKSEVIDVTATEVRTNRLEK